jgi:hypothetical protein
MHSMPVQQQQQSNAQQAAPSSRGQRRGRQPGDGRARQWTLVGHASCPLHGISATLASAVCEAGHLHAQHTHDLRAVGGQPCMWDMQHMQHSIP